MTHIVASNPMNPCYIRNEENPDANDPHIGFRVVREGN